MSSFKQAVRYFMDTLSERIRTGSDLEPNSVEASLCEDGRSAMVCADLTNGETLTVCFDVSNPWTDSTQQDIEQAFMVAAAVVSGIAQGMANAMASLGDGSRNESTGGGVFRF